MNAAHNMTRLILVTPVTPAGVGANTTRIVRRARRSLGVVLVLVRKRPERNEIRRILGDVDGRLPNCCFFGFRILVSVYRVGPVPDTGERP